MTFSLLADVAQLPDWFDRVQNANPLSGSRLDKFAVWPTAEPQIRMAKNENLRITLRVTTPGPSYNPALNQVQAPVNQGLSSTASGSGQGGNGNATAPAVPDKPKPLPSDKLSYKIRQGPNPDTYWLDIDIGPIPDAGEFSDTLSIPASGGKLAGLAVSLDVTVVDDQFILASSSLDLGDVNIPEQKGDAIDIGRFGLRRALRKFQLKEMSSSLPFVRVSAQPIVAGRNYFIKIKLAGDPSLKPGDYEGNIRVVTDDSDHPLIEVPVKLRLIR